MLEPVTERHIGINYDSLEKLIISCSRTIRARAGLALDYFPMKACRVPLTPGP